MSLALPDVLRRHGIRFVHWKSNHHLDAALAGETDLDLLIAAEAAGAWLEAMREAGGLRIESQPWARYPQVEDWLLMDAETGTFVHIHLHFILATGLKRVKHLYLPWTDFVLSHSRLAPGTDWPVPAADVELLVLLIRIWAKMPPWRRWFAPRVPAHILDELNWLQEQAGPDALPAAARELGLDLPFSLPLTEERVVITAAKSLYRQVRRHYRMAWPQALLTAAGLNIRLLSARAWRTWIGPARTGKTIAGGGALVALIGSDGSGKTTLSTALRKWLRYKLDTHLLYMGSGDGAAGPVNRLRKGLSALWKKSNPQGGKAAKIRRDGEQGFAFKCYRLFDLLLLRRKLKYLRLGRRLAEQGSVILLDRYPQDQFDGISDGPRQQSGQGFAWAARMERRLFDEAARLGPDLVLKLHITPELALLRKPDHDAAAVRRKCEIVDALTFRRAETVTIDAALPADQVALAAKRAIWPLLQRGARR